MTLPYMNQDFIYLASASPRRAELLGQIGVRFSTLIPDLDETPLTGELPEDYVVRIAKEKAEFAGEHLVPAGSAVLAADTAVVLGDDIFGKPLDRDDALAMLAKLSGREHRVFTAVALYVEATTRFVVSESKVEFKIFSPGEAEAYWNTGEPADKAGAYGIQGMGAVFVKHLQGSYSGVMGLPLFETAQLLSEAGLASMVTRK